MSRVTLYRVLTLVGFVVAIAVTSTVAAQRTAAAMTSAAEQFLGSLTPAQRAKAALPFSSEDRTRFNFIPTEMFPREGLTINEMTEAQRTAAHDLLRAGLSQVGYATARQIMELEAILAKLETGGRLERDPGKYFFTVFGTPSTEEPWGWRAEGHHVSIHFTVIDGVSVAGSPTFFGTNPAEVKEGPDAGLRILAAEEDTARALLLSLNGSQREKAVMADAAPRDIATGATSQIEPLAAAGIPVSEMTDEQRDLLLRLIGVYVGYMADDVADERMATLRDASVGNIAFAWAGPGERGARHYYRVQGPTFLIEYDNTQNDGNHVHSIWRDYDGDFGRDLLREHLQAYAH